MEDKTTSWSPYLAGSLAGLALGSSAWLSGKLFGSTDAITKSAGLIEGSFAPKHVANNEYFCLNTPEINWQSIFVIGIFFGSLVSAITSGSFRMQGVPDMWQKRFGPSIFKRAIAAFTGGLLAIFGARMANGCPSGQMSGLIQLSVGSLLSLISFFVSGIAISRLLYGKGE